LTGTPPYAIVWRNPLKKQEPLVKAGIQIQRLFNLFIVAAIFLAPGPTQNSVSGSLGKPDPIAASTGESQTSGPVVARVSFTDKQDLDHLAQFLDIWSVDETSHTLVAQLTPLQQSMLLAEGRQVIVDVELTAGLRRLHQALEGQTSGIPGYPCYRTVEETYASLAQIAHDHPGLARWIDIGDSWDKITTGGPAGYDLQVLQLTNHKIPGPKPVFFLMGAIHAREYATAELATRFAEYLVKAYGSNADVTWLLDYNEVQILPVANPDGRKFAETGLLWRKNTDNGEGCLVANAYGIDLNRNYDFKWGGPGASLDACSEVYLGRSAASESETLALQTYLSGLYPDRRGPADGDAAPNDTSGLLISLHSYGQLVLWPWGWTNAPAPNAAQFQTLGRKFAFFNHAIPEQADALYATSGTTDEWLYGRLGTAAYTFEMGTAFFQACSTFETSLYPDNLQALLYALKAARRPYQTPAGPDTLNINLSTNVVTAGAVFSLTVTADDTRYSGGEASQPIANARYSIDAPSWISGTQTTALHAADGVLDKPIENLQGTIDTGTLTSGRHLVFIESQDTAGNWGPPSAQFFYLLDPTTNPHLEGRVRSAADNQPLAAAIQAGPFKTQSDPATGYYTMTMLGGNYPASASAVGFLTAKAGTLTIGPSGAYKQDFTLYPVCSLLNNEVESGPQGWAAQGGWGITQEQAHSPTHAWTDSPGGSYPDNQDASLTSPIFQLSGMQGVQLSYWQRYNTEANYDFARVEYSIDGGTTWSSVAMYSGQSPDWSQINLSIPALNEQPQVRIRFRLTSDGAVNADGWYVDDIHLSAGGNGCVKPIAPAASFTSDSPVPFGEPVRFVDLSRGSAPLKHTWKFGDGVGKSTLSDPTYLFPSPGTFTVTLMVDNPAGSSQLQAPVVITNSQCISLTQIALTPPALIYAGKSTDLKVDLSPDTATRPYHYNLSFNDGSAPISSTSSHDPLQIAHTFPITGTFMITTTASNCAMQQPLMDSTLITVTESPKQAFYFPIYLYSGRQPAQ
jgi:carboxypeptidase T